MLEGAWTALSTFDPAKLEADGDAVADELRDFLISSVSELLREFANKAAERTGDDATSADGPVRDAMNALRSSGRELEKELAAALAANFDPDAEQRSMQATISISFEDLSLQNPESLDESIAVSNVGNRGEMLYEHQLWEIRQRMEWWRGQRHARVSDKSLAPYALCRAFFEAVRVLDVDPPTRLALFWQFDRYVFRKLHDTYEGLVKIFDAHGFLPLKVQAGQPPRKKSESIDQGAVNEQHAADMKAPLDTADSADDGELVRIDRQTLQMLTQMGQMLGVGGQSSGGAGRTAEAFGYSDAHLAQDLSAVLTGDEVPGWGPEQVQELSSRVSAIGSTFNQIVTDPHVPGAIKPQFDSLRFSILKTALADPRFFSDAQHPMRKLLNELAQLAAAARLSSEEEQGRLGQLLTGLHQQYAVQATDVAQAIQKKATVPEGALEQFLEQQVRDQKARRESLLERSRKVVSEELWLHLVGRTIDARLKETLVEGWEPMMALRLLRHGVNSRLWKRGVVLLKRIADTADPPIGVHIDAEEIEDLGKDFATQLEHVGLVKARVARLTNALMDSLRPTSELVTATEAAVAQAGAALPDTQEGWLDMALAPESWYEVFDQAQDTVRWMQALGRDETGEFAVFTEFSGEENYRLPIAEFIEGLQRGVTAAVNPSPMAREALSALLQ